ncbi:MAG: hypothetical protein K2H64_01395 [Desulfovibrio sp.]|nr:hypothetical protein [Desulfovibrio sp.]
MRILKAYTEAGTSGKQGLGLAGKIAKSEPRSRPSAQPWGDSVNLSPEAMALLNSDDNGFMNSSPDDGLYDQSGNMTRQFDAAQDELRRLAAQFASSAKTRDIAGKISGLSGQLSGIQLRV